MNLQDARLRHCKQETAAQALSDPYRVAVSLWKGELLDLTAAQKKQIAVIRYFPRIAEAGRADWFGGDQNWFKRKTQRYASCGPVAAANTLACFSAQVPAMASALGLSFLPDGRIDKAHYLAFMEQIYKTVGTMEVPVWRNLVEKYPKEKPFIPPSLGRECSGFERGVLQHAAKHGVWLCAHHLLTSYVGKAEAMAFIQKGLQGGSPVTLLTLQNRHPLSVYWSGYEMPPKATEKGMSRHFVSVVGIRTKSPGETELLVSSWGRICAIDFAALYKSWQSPRAFGSALMYFTKSANERLTLRQILSAYGMIPESLVKTASGAAKNIVTALEKRK